MNRWTTALLLVTFSSCASADDGARMFLASTDYSLSKEQIAKYSQEAMAGSPDAANTLANSFWMRGVPDHEKTKYWALIGAENGSAESQFRAFQTLHSSPHSLDQERALFWLKKAAEKNYVSAVAVLEACPTVSTRWHDRWPCFGPGSDR